MSSPGGPTVEPTLEGDALEIDLTIELSQAQLTALATTTDAIFEMPGTVNLDSDLFANAMKITVSCQQPWVPYP